MRKLSLLTALALVLAACGGSGGGSSMHATPGHGAISVQVNPNPIVATNGSGNTYNFPFEVVVRETGGRPITVTRISANVLFGGGLSIGSESWDEAQIRAMGYDPNIPANGEVRYRFNPRREVPSASLFNGVSAELRIEARDDTGTATNATTTVTVTR